jgi:hypothetical protein
LLACVSDAMDRLWDRRASVLVHTPIPFLIQIENDPDWAPEEIREVIKWEPDSEVARKIAECDARLSRQPLRIR